MEEWTTEKIQAQLAIHQARNSDPYVQTLLQLLLSERLKRLAFHGCVGRIGVEIDNLAQTGLLRDIVVPGKEG